MKLYYYLLARKRANFFEIFDFRQQIHLFFYFWKKHQTERAHIEWNLYSINFWIFPLKNFIEDFSVDLLACFSCKLRENEAHLHNYWYRFIGLFSIWLGIWVSTRIKITCFLRFFFSFSSFICRFLYFSVNLKTSSWRCFYLSIFFFKKKKWNVSEVCVSCLIA